jgi:hypothetical protein
VRFDNLDSLNPINEEQLANAHVLKKSEDQILRTQNQNQEGNGTAQNAGMIYSRSAAS